WQRSRQRKHVPWCLRWRDLAALHATLGPESASLRDRLRCLQAYLRAFTYDRRELRARRREAIAAIEKHERVLLRRRHVVQSRQACRPIGTSGIRWLDGEALCVTEDFWQELGGRTPRCLRLRALTSPIKESRQRVQLPAGGTGLLVHRRRSQPLRWLWSLLRG